MRKVGPEKCVPIEVCETFEEEVCEENNSKSMEVSPEFEKYFLYDTVTNVYSLLIKKLTNFSKPGFKKIQFSQSSFLQNVLYLDTFTRKTTQSFVAFVIKDRCKLYFFRLHYKTSKAVQ